MIILIAAISIMIYAVIVAVATVVIKRVWLTHKRKAKIQIYTYNPPQNYEEENTFIESPTGWIWNEEKKLWEPPNYLAKESKDRWEWDPEKGIWKDKSK